MTDKTKMSNLESYQELTIQISTLNLKLDAILKLLNKPEVNIKPLEIMGLEDVLKHNRGAVNLFKDLVPAGSDVDCSSVNAIGKLEANPLQWPKEPLTDYLKRIGQYNEAQSTDEEFLESYK